MQQTKNIMGMHVTIEVKDKNPEQAFDIVFEYLNYIDEKFSTYKSTSEISKINRKELEEIDYSADMREILRLAEQTKLDTQGYFDIHRPGTTDTDPSGIVKGWAIWQAGLLLEKNGFKNFFIDAGGDIQARVPDGAQFWRVGIRNPFNLQQIVKVLQIKNEGVATSGTYERGQHIYNPNNVGDPLTEIVSITVVGPNVYEADRFATAAFAMGKAGIEFIESQPNLEGYIINNEGVATQTSKLEKYIIT